MCKQQPSMCAKKRNVEDLVKLHIRSTNKNGKCLHFQWGLRWRGVYCSTFLSLITGFLGRGTGSVSGNHVLYHVVTLPQQRYLNNCPPDSHNTSLKVLRITLEQLAQANIHSHKHQNMGSWCYETLPQKVTHLSPITFLAIPANGRNFLRN